MTEQKVQVTPEMARYIELDAQEKAIKDEKEKLRAVVIKQFGTGDTYEGMSWTSRKDIRMKKKEFFDWVLQTWPHLINDLRVDEIDVEKFERANAFGQIDYSEIPEHTYSYATIDVISIAANRRSNKTSG